MVASDCLGRVQILYRELSQRLIVLREMALHLALQLVGLLIVALAQRLANDRNRFVGLRRIDVHVAGLARPQRDVVQRDAIGLRAAIDNAAHGAITNHQCLLKVSGRFVVV